MSFQKKKSNILFLDLVAIQLSVEFTFVQQLSNTDFPSGMKVIKRDLFISLIVFSRFS